MEKFYTIQEAAKKLGVHIETLRRWDRTGKLKAQRIGNSSHRRYPDSLLQKIKKNAKLLYSESNTGFPSVPFADKVLDFNSSTIPTSDYFTRLVLSVAERVEKLVDCEIIDGPYDKKRDIIGYHLQKNNKKALTYIQTKRQMDLSVQDLKNEVEQLYKNVESGGINRPTKLIFALSIDLNATERDEVRRYCKQFFPQTDLVFWCAKELDQKVKSDHSIMSQFILTGLLELVSYENLEEKRESIRIVKKSVADIDMTVSDSLKGKHLSLDRKIRRTAQLLETRQILEARSKLLQLIGEVPDDSEFAHERARIYNNLGVSYKGFGPESDYNKAIEYFNKSLDENPDLWKARCNLALSHLLRNEEGDTTRAWEYIKPLWDKKGPADPLILLTYLDIYDALNGYEATYKETEAIKTKYGTSNKVFDNAAYRHFISGLLIKLKKYTPAEDYIEQNIKENPYDVDALYMKVILILSRANQQVRLSDLDLMPSFEDPKHIQEATKILEQAYELAVKDKRYDLIPEIYHNWNICRLWLWRNKGEKINNLKYSLPDETKTIKYPVIDIQEAIYKKDFQGAYERLKEFTDGKKIIPQEKLHLSRVFLYNGSPEYAIRLLEEIENEFPNKLPSGYWLDKSLSEVLLENKYGAIQAGKNAKDLAEKEDKESLKTALSHFGALLSRYDKEGDRLLENMLQYDREFPDAKAVTKLDIENDQDKNFILKTMEDRRIWFDGILNTYKNNPLPSYSLEKPFKRTFAELWSGRGVIFPWESMQPGQDFEDSLIACLDKADVLVFDYMSLLAMTKANLLGYLPRLNKKLIIHFSTFLKIQEELVKYENKTLRKLWNFLRSSTSLEFYYAPVELDNQISKLSKMLGNWLVQSIQLAKDKNYVFVTDDLRLLKAIKHEGIDTINSFIFMKYFFQKNYFDQKSYSQALGEFADCVYTFLPFSGDDLHEIVWIDEYKLTRRSFHLIHQLLLPGSDVISFMGVFVGFIRKLWSTGALPEDKVFWLGFITDEVNLLVQEWEKRKEPVDNVKIRFAELFAELWGGAIERGTLEDVKVLESKCEEFLNNHTFSQALESIKKHIALRKEVLQKKKESK